MDDEVIFLYRAYDALFNYEEREIGALTAKSALAFVAGDTPITDFLPPLSALHPKAISKPVKTKPDRPITESELLKVFGGGH